jgi:succinate dehydrogenase / fumarate reductase membrane anchor subunit
MSLRSPLGQVLGLGAAGGAHHWWLQRLSSVALVPLSAWFVIGLLRLPDLGWASVHHWLARPLSSVLLLMLVPAAVHHSWLGVAVVVEDYVHGRWLKPLTLLMLQLAHLALGAVALFAVLRIAFGPAQ